MASLDAQQREQVQSAMSYEEDQLGALMDFEMVTIREDVSLEVVLRYLRRFEELPAQTDKLFVVNHDNLLTGVLPLQWLLVNSPDKMVSDVMAPDVNTFHPARRCLRGGAGVRALRPGHRAGGGWRRSPDRPHHHRRDGRRDPRGE